MNDVYVFTCAYCEKKIVLDLKNVNGELQVICTDSQCNGEHIVVTKRNKDGLPLVNIFVPYH